MLLQYLKSSFRYMRRFAMQNIISMAGLAAGFVAFSFSQLWTGYVNSYDSFHKDADRIYTFAFNEDGRTTVGNERTRTNGDIYYLLFREFKERNILDSLGVESFLFYDEQGGPGSYYTESEPLCLCIDSAFLDFFNPVLLAGDWSFLDDLGKIAVSKSYALKEFGDEYPIGKEITQRRSTYTVSAVIDDFDHSYIKFDMMKKWNGYSMFYYNWLLFKLKEGVSVQDMLDMCYAHMEGRFSKPKDALRGKRIVPLKEVYRTIDEAQDDTFVKYDGLDLISKASLLILLCAIVNHFTFFLNYLRGRRREMTLRKVNGASTSDIAVQMVSESSIPVLGALLIGMFAVIMLKEPFMRLADIGMPDSYYLKGSLTIMAVVLAVSVMLSLVEVMVMNRKTLQSGIRQSNDKAFRRISTGIQIASGMTLMFALTVMLHQFNFMHNINWGTQRKDVAVVNIKQKEPEKEFFPGGLFRYVNEHPLWGDEYMDELEKEHGLKSKIASIPCVTGVYMNFADMSVSHYGHAALVSSSEALEDHLFPDVFDYIYPGLIDRLGLAVLEGAIPSEGIKDDEVVITENLFKDLGGTTLDKMPVIYIRLGRSGMEMTPFTIAAVVKNIHLYNYDDIPPYVLLCGFHNKYLIEEDSYGHDRGSGTINGEVSVKYLHNCKAELEEALGELLGGLGLEYEVKYPEDSFFKHLTKDRNLSKMLSILCVISIFIALFGVFSQISLSCLERRREIAIRKTHGAKVKEILVIFAREYGMIFLVSSVVAMALGHIVMHRWIEQFYYQAAISWWIYLSVFAFTALVIVVTVLNRVLTTARENPADVIKSE